MATATKSPKDRPLIVTPEDEGTKENSTALVVVGIAALPLLLLIFLVSGGAFVYSAVASTTKREAERQEQLKEIENDVERLRQRRDDINKKLQDREDRIREYYSEEHGRNDRDLKEWFETPIKLRGPEPKSGAQSPPAKLGKAATAWGNGAKK